VTATADGFAFRLGDIPVVVRWTFFLTLAILGASRDVALVAVWLVAAFIAVLVHELGHALTAKAFGQEASIELFAMGGLTFPRGRPLSNVQSIALSLAGPGLGFAFGALVWAIDRAVGPEHRMADAFVNDLLWCSIGWGVFNLVPILPMDGGQAMEKVFVIVLGPETGPRLALVVSLLAAAVGLVFAILVRMPWAGLLCVLFAFSSFQRLRDLRAAGSRPPLPPTP
jgi:stage IV sporulation protein FB